MANQPNTSKARQWLRDVRDTAINQGKEAARETVVRYLPLREWAQEGIRRFKNKLEIGGTPAKENEENFDQLITLLRICGRDGSTWADSLEQLAREMEAIDPSAAARWKESLFGGFKGKFQEFVDKHESDDQQKLWNLLSQTPKLREARKYHGLVTAEERKGKGVREAAQIVATTTVPSLQSKAGKSLARVRQFFVNHPAPRIKTKGWIVFSLLLLLCFVPLFCSKPGDPVKKDFSACERAQACKKLATDSQECTKLLEQWGNACGLISPTADFDEALKKRVTAARSVIMRLAYLKPKPNLSVNQTTRDSLGEVTLSWNPEDAEKCKASWTSAGFIPAAPGTTKVYVAEETTHALTCEGKGGTETDSVTIRVSNTTTR